MRLTDRDLFVPWLVWAALCVTAMVVSPGEETIPYHLGYAGLAVASGINAWSGRRAMAALVAYTVATGAILVWRASHGVLDWGETAEIPLMWLIMSLMIWHLLHRNASLALAQRIAAREREQSNRRERMTRMASHEMRNPLAIAMGYVDLIELDSADEERRLADLGVVKEELDRLSTACDRLLHLLHLHEDLPVAPVDVDALLSRIEERWRIVAERTWEAHSSVGVVEANEDRLRACLETLIENALRYTHTGDVVRLFALPYGSDLVIGVADSGTGFTDAQADAINAALPVGPTPLPPTPSDPRSQTGLGLSMVREIVASQGGRLEATHAPEGGAQVTMILPLQAPVTALGPLLEPATGVGAVS